MSNQKVTLIHHVAIQTSDLDRALRFYVEVLGAELLERRRFKRREQAWLRVGEVRLELYTVRDGETLDAWSDRYAGPVHLAFAVPDLEGFLAAAWERGARFHPSHPAPFVPPVAGAGLIAYLEGPDGEEVEIRSAADPS
jgi:glyoxylase I family protein